MAWMEAHEQGGEGWQSFGDLGMIVQAFLFEGLKFQALWEGL
jgi:hypothetical protein